MCLALFPFSVNAASIEDILGEWQSEKPVPLKGVEYIVISENAFQIKPKKQDKATIEKNGNTFKIIITYGHGDYKIIAEKNFTLEKDGRLLYRYTGSGGKQYQRYYIRPPKSPDHQ